MKLVLATFPSLSPVVMYCWFLSPCVYSNLIVPLLDLYSVSVRSTIIHLCFFAYCWSRFSAWICRRTSSSQTWRATTMERTARPWHDTACPATRTLHRSHEEDLHRGLEPNYHWGWSQEFFLNTRNSECCWRLLCSLHVVRLSSIWNYKRYSNAAHVIFPGLLEYRLPFFSFLFRAFADLTWGLQHITLCGVLVLLLLHRWRRWFSNTTSRTIACEGSALSPLIQKVPWITLWRDAMWHWTPRTYVSNACCRDDDVVYSVGVALFVLLAWRSFCWHDSALAMELCLLVGVHSSIRVWCGNRPATYFCHSLSCASW